MDSLAYLHLALAYQDPTSTKRVLRKSIQQFWQQLLAKPISSRLILRLLSLGIALAILTLAQVALALRFGDSGTDVAQLQQNLQLLGYYRGPITRVFDGATEQAVLGFQRDAGIGVDGIVGSETQSAINRILFNQLPQAGFNTFPQILPPPPAPFNTPSFTPGITFGDPFPNSFNPALGQPNFNQPFGTNFGLQQVTPSSPIGQIQLLQSRLQDLGWYRGTIDGIYGQLTTEAVEQFQRFRGLFPSGIADSRTLAELGLGSDPIAGGNNTFPRVTLQGYVVVIPTGNNFVYQQIRIRYPSAIQTRNRRGRFVYIQAYDNRDRAESQSALLRSQGFTNARVVYFR
ncbi:peptidoglycan-binding domain-containing protein [Roseofilum reptotaenium CS-1145]|uniref:Peptidoglycan binding-like domain-containing protein n=1 Tax=Roseofilum reptotaenium AO1-A TaxID=1925591 RepID=A0A1L9QV70_9CYAN|nr:peptidoglycan-binding domain-containing protein [Roseofilum reptotaenium]MDB9518792.1 peptidoglycan-binding domain-containing protein [Roseofilum reptotaenium CS-1145]OJJ26581.1 hypothetical protein BI308_05670 [Roseofilum reptotaenium AO1-A]